MAIALIDYGAGNHTSVRKAFDVAGAAVVTPAVPDDLDHCTGIVVPGVGHFAATAALNDGWREAIARRVEAGVPVLGICLGMQWLFEGSVEAPDVPGLGVFAGHCTRIAADRPLKVPHVGWNALRVTRDAAILGGVDDGTHVYFTHSFAAPVTEVCAASATHGEAFAAVVERGAIAGVQFHPEKSGPAGLQMVRNFLAITAR